MGGVRKNQVTYRKLPRLRFNRAVSLLVTFTMTPFLPAQAPTIHQYADAAACQMGAREARYLPSGITPTSGKKIPITWQGMELVWVPNTTPPDGTGEFKVNDPKNGLQPIGMNYPENLAGGPFTNPVQSNPKNATGSNLKCDHFPYVDPSCTPEQYVKEIFQGSCEDGPSKGAVCSIDDQCGAGNICGGMVRWHVLFRRGAAAAKAIDNDPATAQPPDWEITLTAPPGVTPPKTSAYIPYYDVVDAIGLKEDTYGTVWLDGLGSTAAARDFKNGFRAGPMPRPGGKRPDTRTEGKRATKWYDAPATIKAGSCNDCHATPFNGSDWLKQSGLPFKDDEIMPWWYAGNEVIGFAQKTFFEKAKDTAKMPVTSFTCGGCHARWLTGAGGTPGGEITMGAIPFARYMTMVHDAHTAAGVDSEGKPDIDNPFKTVPGASVYRTLASSFRTDAPQAAFLDKNAKQTHWMPVPNNQATVRDWTATFRENYNAVACCGAGLGGVLGQPPNTGDGPAFNCSKITCTNQVSQTDVKAGFITPWMQANAKTPVVPATSNASQFIDSPDPAASPSLTIVDCPAAIPAPNAGDRCFRLTWSDPNGSPFNAPQTFHFSQLPNKKVSDPDWTPADIQSIQYCGDGLPSALTVDPASSVFPKVKESQIPTASADKWRFSYETFGPLAKCQKMALRLCGGWCPQTIQLAGEAAPAGPNRLATDLGRILTLANDTLGDFTNQMSITRSGFRKNLTTGRFVQTVTLKNTGAAAIPAPLSYVLKNLSANATLFNLSGTVGSPASPYVSVPGIGDSLQVNPGDTLSLTLEFTNPTNQAITYTSQVLGLTVSTDCK